MSAWHACSWQINWVYSAKPMGLMLRNSLKVEEYDLFPTKKIPPFLIATKPGAITVRHDLMLKNYIAFVPGSLYS